MKANTKLIALGIIAAGLVTSAAVTGSAIPTGSAALARSPK